MAGFEAVVINLDGLSLIKLLQKAYFEQDSINQAMMDITKVNKQLMLCWKKPGMKIDANMVDFKAKADMCKAVGSAISISQTMTRLTYTH